MADHFDAWRPKREDIQVETDWKQHCQYNAHSIPLSFPSAESSAHITLPLFGVATTAGDVSSSDPSTSSARVKTFPNDKAHDIVLHVGGPVWGMDWCPSMLHLPSTIEKTATKPSSSSTPPQPTIPTRYLAIGCHPMYSSSNRIGIPVTGPGVIQIWEISDPEFSTSQKGGSRKHTPQPRLALAIAHDGGLTWQCKWCPSRSLTSPPTAQITEDGVLPRLGLLAAALGDGSIRIWAVPQPRALRHASNLLPSNNNKNSPTPPLEEPLVITLAPVAVLTSAHLNGALPSVLDWLPSPPYDALLVGCWSGAVAVVKLRPDLESTRTTREGATSILKSPTRQMNVNRLSGTSNEPDRGPSTSSVSQEEGNVPPVGCEILTQFPADAIPLRAAKWIPPDVGQVDTLDKAHRSIFATVGHEGTLKIWDIRDEFEPVYFQGLSTSLCYDVAWTIQPFGVMVAVEDASLRGILLGSKEMLQQKGTKGSKPAHSVVWRGSNVGGLWAVAVNPITNEVVYAGEDGVIGNFTAEYWWDNRKRKEHGALGALQMHNGTLRILTTADINEGGGPGLYVDRTVDRMQALVANVGYVSDEMQAIYRLAWGPDGSGWLASGGAAGVVRCQWITFT